jgi:hypothetical protein
LGTTSLGLERAGRSGGVRVRVWGEGCAERDPGSCTAAAGMLLLLLMLLMLILMLPVLILVMAKDGARHYGDVARRSILLCAARHWGEELYSSSRPLSAWRGLGGPLGGAPCWAQAQAWASAAE